MKSRFLFPPHYRKIGWCLALPGFIAGYFMMYHHFSIPFLTKGKGGLFGAYANTYTDELALVMVIIGLLFIAFSKEKKEDELISRLRMDALYWSVLFNSLVYLVLAFLTDSIDLTIYNLFTPLLVFIMRFNYLMHFKKETYIVRNLYFLPHVPFRWIAVILTIVSLSILIIIGLGNFQIKSNWLEEPLYISLFPSLLGWVYSYNKFEDELIMQYRLDSMYLAVLINYVLLLIATLVLYNLDYLFVMTVHCISIPVLFIIRFTYVSISNKLLEAKQLKGGLLA